MFMGGHYIENTDDLGALNGTYHTLATEINDDGIVVGKAQQMTFVYQNGALSDLNDNLPPDSGWRVLTEATDINNKSDIMG
jgi:hypothetical protein